MLDAEQVRALEQVAHILDPVQLLSQLERMQKALWRHAIFPKVQPQHVLGNATVHFSLDRATSDQASNDPSPEAQVEDKPLPLPKRQQKKYE